MPNDDPEIPREPDQDNTQASNVGTAVSVGFVVLVVVAVCVAGWIYTDTTKNDPGVTTCSTSCLGFIKLGCPGGRYMGTCFGISVCGSPTHTCGVDAQKLDRQKSLWASVPARGAHECRFTPLPRATKVCGL
jgi:hypothetical protein